MTLSNECADSGAMDPAAIAIVEMGCRWPGNVRTPGEFWDLLKEARHGYREFGDHRFPRRGFHHPSSDHPGTTCAEGGFLLSEDPRLFDHAFFGIGSAEVETMDPSQRKLLEVVYEAFENAGETWDTFSGSTTGVYVGNFTSDHLIIQSRDMDHPRPYAGIGTGNSILSNRINYIFNLRGPSLTLDTAYCDSAIVAGSNTIMDPSTQLTMTKLGVLSPTSISHTFDATADGYARGEAFAALYVKPLAAALKDGNPIRAIIRSTAVNANGRTGGITHPGREGQETLIHRAYDKAGLHVKDTTYFECHGTGTLMGDPIEVEAIGNVFECNTSPERPLLIGSLKPNIGHTEPVSGIAGIMKVVLAMEAGLIPATIGVKNLNPKLNTREGRIQIVAHNTPWPEGRLRRASVNSFGYGGANSHCIIDHFDSRFISDLELSATHDSNGTCPPQTNGYINIVNEELWKTHYPLTTRPPLLQSSKEFSASRRWVILPFSAHNESSLELNVATVSSALTLYSIADVAYTLADKRSRFKYRTFRIIDRDDPKPSLKISEQVLAPYSQHAKLGFIFTGQGAQWHAMGSKLFEYAVFRTSIDYLDALLQRLPSPPKWKIGDVLSGRYDPAAVHQPEVAQTVCTALQIGLVDLFDVWAIRPAVVVGHSSGEIASAITIAYYRGYVVSLRKKKGAMLAVGLESEIRIAAINSPKSVILSGDEGVFNRMLHTGVIGEEYEKLLSDGFACRYPRGADPWVSSITPSYWRANLESPTGNVNVLIEIGPHAALNGPVNDMLRGLESKIPYVATLKRNEDTSLALLRLAGKLFCLNSTVELAAVNSLIRGNITAFLPPYCYTYGPIIYHESRISKEIRSRSLPRHELLGSMLPGTAILRPQWRNVLRLKDAPWLEHHRLLPHAVFPAAGYIAMALEAASRIFHERTMAGTIVGFDLRNLSFSTVMLMTSMELDDTYSKSPSWARFSVNSVTRDLGHWTQHCVGLVRVRTETPRDDAFAPMSIDMDEVTVHASSWYTRFTELGLEYGPTFQSLSHIQTDSARSLAVARVALHIVRNSDPHKDHASAYPLHPASLDAAFQLSSIATHGGQPDSAQNAFVPVEIDELYIKNEIPANKQKWATAIATAHKHGLRSAHAKIQLLDATTGKVVMNLNNLRCLAYTEVQRAEPFQSALNQSPFSSPYFRLTWKLDVRVINGDRAASLFPPLLKSKHKIHLFEKIEQLSTLCVAEINEHYASLTELSHATANIQHYLSWVRRCMEAKNEYTVKAKHLTSSERQEIISQISEEFGHVPDVKIASTVFNRTADLLFERATGLDVMLQDDMLHKLYDDGFLVEGAYGQLARFMDSYGHCHPNARIIELGAGTGGATRRILQTLTTMGSIKRYKDYTFTDISSGFLTSARDSLSHFRDIHYAGFDAVYDVVLASECLHATHSISETLANCRKLLKPGGKLILVENTRALVGHGLVLGHLSGYWDGISDGRVDSPFLHLERWNTELIRAGFSGAEVVLDDFPAPYSTARTIVSTTLTSIGVLSGGDETESALLSGAAAELESRNIDFRIRSLNEIEDLPQNCNIIAFVAGENLLVNADERRLTTLKRLVRNSASLLWITSCGIACGNNPDTGVTIGLLRTIASENPEKQFMSIDVDPANDLSDAQLASTIVETGSSSWEGNKEDGRDREFVWQHGCLWVSRLVPDAQLHDQLELFDSPPNRAETTPWDPQGNLRAAFETPGVLTSLYFKPYEETWRPLPDDWIQVKVVAAGLNWKDLLACTGRFDVNNLSSEYSRIVCRVGSQVTTVAVGDRVYGYGRGHFGNYLQGPSRGACLMQLDDDPIRMAALPIVCMTAVYALGRAARLERMERILIMSATGGLGLAVMQLAKSKGAEIYATAGTEEKQQFLAEVEGIPAEHIFCSRDVTDIPRMFDATQRKGFDVIISTASGELLHEATRILAPMGRFIDLGRLDAMNAESLGMEIFRNNATFISFDLGVAEETGSDLCPSLMSAVNDHIRAGTLVPTNPITTFHVSQLDQALSTLSRDHPTSPVKTVPLLPRAVFHPEANYLIIGGFGTLGRSILAFMASRGATHLTVLARSKSRGREAAQLVESLSTQGTRVTRAVNEAEAVRPIKGIVHVAMFLQDVSFDKLGIDGWTSALAAKVHGTKNLHEATRSCSLEFFVMATSIETIRRRQGLPAATASFRLISDKGDLSQNPTTIALMARNRVLQVTQSQLLKLLEPCFLNNEARPTSPGPTYIGAEDDPLSMANIITCFDPAALAARAREDGEITALPRWYTDPRVSLIRRAMKDAERAQSRSDNVEPQQDQPNSTLASDFATALESAKAGNEAELSAAIELVANATAHTVAQMLFIDASAVETAKSVGHYGVDSLVAAELRSWLNLTFGADVDVLEMLDTGNTIWTLAAGIIQRSLEGKW
ncbi:polyketide synthase [Xylaria arbuscula]|nr:polyketide synthase [Xylaria arbuscula]